jgi:hypothetical protein
VSRWDDQNVVFFGNDPTGDVRGRVLDADDCQVELVLEYGAKRLDAERRAAKDKLDPGVALADDTAQTAYQSVGRRPREADTHAPGLTPTRELDGPPCRTKTVEHLTCWPDEGFSGAGESDGSRRSIEELSAQVSLEGLDQAAERRLGDVQPLCGATEVQLVRHSQECLEIMHVHPHTVALTV